MKRTELLQLTDCKLCGKKIGSAITFHVVTVQRFILDPQAIQRHAGLEMMTSPAIASIMGTDEDMAHPLRDTPIKFSVCQDCAAEDFNLWQIEECCTEEPEATNGS